MSCNINPIDGPGKYRMRNGEEIELEIYQPIRDGIYLIPVYGTKLYAVNSFESTGNLIDFSDHPEDIVEKLK